MAIETGGKKSVAILQNDNIKHKPPPPNSKIWNFDHTKRLWYFTTSYTVVLTLYSDTLKTNWRATSLHCPYTEFILSITQ